MYHDLWVVWIIRSFVTLVWPCKILYVLCINVSTSYKQRNIQKTQICKLYIKHFAKANPEYQTEFLQLYIEEFITLQVVYLLYGTKNVITMQFWVRSFGMIHLLRIWHFIILRHMQCLNTTTLIFRKRVTKKQTDYNCFS